MIADWQVYQRERFPLVRHAPLVAVTCLCTLAFTLNAQGQPRFPSAAVWLGSSLVTLGLFFILRVLDEFKDFADDAKFRPYRPIPRGVLKLRDLAVAGAAVAGLQLGLTLLAAPRGVIPLLVCWAFMALMAAEFFVSHWLKARPLLYMLSHAPITGLIQIAASAWVWQGGWRDAMPSQVIGLALGATAAGTVLEIGRKLRAPEDEEPGVDTYTAVWGRGAAVGAWWLAGAVSALLTLVTGFGALTVVLMTALVALSLWAGLNFQSRPSSANARWFEPVSALWALGVFGSLALTGAL
jgi:UbiA prenyltransferase family